MLKILSISKKQVDRRIDYDYSILEKTVQIRNNSTGFCRPFYELGICEYFSCYQPALSLSWHYMPIPNKILSRLVRHLRSRFGTILLQAGNVKIEMEGWEGKPYVLGVAADQSPSNTLEAYWLSFMNQPSGFIKKPWEKVKSLGHAAVYMKMKRIKRGFYRFEVVPIVEDTSLVSGEELVLRYRDLLEEDINRNPDNYLWTHRRWKKKWKEEYEPLWIDKEPVVIT
jgi:KDO2-lipid IV(A) lauroyltransferase